MITVTIMKKKNKLWWEYLKASVGTFQAEIFWVGVFLILKKIYVKNPQVYMH